MKNLERPFISKENKLKIITPHIRYIGIYTKSWEEIKHSSIVQGRYL
jgi:hypothetical protein